jgi:hypothetical protein
MIRSATASKVVGKHCPIKQMWTDINTKSKQGLLFQVFQGHVMDISEDYKDADYFGNVPTSPPMSMLPLSKEQLASKECVKEQMNSHILTSARLNVGGSAKRNADMKQVSVSDAPQLRSDQQS